MTRRQELVQRRWIRKFARAEIRTPIVLVEGNSMPQYLEEGYHYETLTGKPIYHPIAYAKKGRSNMVYCASTLRIEVGQDWIAAHPTEEDALVWRDSQIDMGVLK
jgi:hypothetical protein